MLNDEFIAGVWRSKLLECLWWGPLLPSISAQLIRTTKCGAPTWSWASICRKDPLIELKGRRFFFAPPLPIERLVQILDLTWSAPGASKQDSAPGAHITLSGNLLRGYAYLEGEKSVNRRKDLVTITQVLKSYPEKTQKLDLYQGMANWQLRLCSESFGRRVTVTILIEPDTHDGIVEGFLYLLPLAKSIGPIEWDEGTELPPAPGGRVFALLLKEVGQQVFERVGCAEFNEGFLMTVENQAITIK